MFPFPPFPAGVPWTVLGLMAGTSADGADAALIRVAPAGFRDGKPFRRLRLELGRRLPELGLEEDLHFPPGAREAVSWALLVAG